MALIIPPGYLHAVYRFSLEGDSEEMVVTCGHQIEAASGATGELAPNDLFASFRFSIVPGLPTTMQFMGVDVYVGNDGPDTFVYASSEPPEPGTNASPIVPPNSAYLIRKRTDAAGRRGRGRLYLPGVFENSVDNVGNVLESSVTAYQASWDAWWTDLTQMVGGRHYPPVILHRSEGIGTEPAPTPITRFVFEPKIATQRRRLRP